MKSYLVLLVFKATKFRGGHSDQNNKRDRFCAACIDWHRPCNEGGHYEIKRSIGIINNNKKF